MTENDEKQALMQKVIAANARARALQTQLDNYGANRTSVDIIGVQYAPEWLADVLVLRKANGDLGFVRIGETVYEAFSK